MKNSKSLAGAKPNDLYVDKQGRAYMITARFDGPTVIVQCLTPAQGEAPSRIGTLDDPQFGGLERVHRPTPVKPVKAPKEKKV